MIWKTLTKIFYLKREKYCRKICRIVKQSLAAEWRIFYLPPLLNYFVQLWLTKRKSMAVKLVIHIQF